MDFRGHVPAYSRPNYPNTTPTHPLNPAAPGFQPTGSEMQRWKQQFPPTPPSTNNLMGSGELVHMRSYLLNSHFSQVKEITSLQRALEREAQHSHNEVEDIKATVRRDLQTLQAQIQSVKEQLQPHQGDGMLTPRASNARLPPMAHLYDSLSQSSLAEIYLEEAETMEATAAKLRTQAGEITGNDDKPQINTMKLLEGAKDLADMSKHKAGFACCGKKYSALNELLEHVSATHPTKDQHAEVPNRDNAATPTHVPPRRAKAATTVDNTKEDTATEIQMLRSELAKATAELSKKQSESSVTQPKSPNGGQDWMPLAVRQMPTPPVLNVENNETFSWELINTTFQGKQHSPGFYFIAKDSIIESRSYWVLEQDYEPYLPKAPGHHGAKITAVFNGTETTAGDAAPDETNYLNVPLFIRARGQQTYQYWGNYSQKRFSDKLSYDQVANDRIVPAEVRNYWAHQLSQSGRPSWVSDELISHFFPRPEYLGPIPTDSAVATPVTTETPTTTSTEILEKRVTKALHQYALELKEWKKDADLKVKHLTAKNLLDAFMNADADETPGLRLYWEYMQFEKFDNSIVQHLISKKHSMETAALSEAAQKATGNVRSTETAQASSDADTAIPISPSKLKRSNNAVTTPNWKTSTEKSYKASVKPWEQPSQAKKTENSKPTGDLQMAKQLRAEVKQHFAPGQGRDKEGKKPPHMRHAK